MTQTVKKSVIIIGSGLTGLVCAFYLKKKGIDILVVEKQNRAGGNIRTHNENGYIFDSGPNTGSLSQPEMVELFEDLKDYCTLQPAKKSAHRRLILKGGKLHNLPCGIISGFFTPLFTWKDKFRILFEPFRKRGANPDESVAELAIRRLGKSYFNYAVDPFISGIYAGDPFSLITRFAIPKLYSLEQQYGSFIKGAIKKAREPKTERDKKVTREVFSVKGGMENLVNALVKAIGTENILLGNERIDISGTANQWTVRLDKDEFVAPLVISTVGAYVLPALFPFAPPSLMSKINNLRYAKVIQVSVGLSAVSGIDLHAFGALIPSVENRRILGVLHPSACFEGRSPEGKVLLSVFLGGIRNPELFDLSDEQLKALITDELRIVFRKPDLEPEFIRIFKHPHAIPQYEKNTGDRLQAIEEFQQLYPGIILAGNLRDGIGMADRVKQAVNIVGN